MTKTLKISFFAHSSLIYNIPEKFTGTKIHIFRGFITINIWHLLSFWKSFGIPRKTFNYHHSSTFYVVFNAKSCFCLRIKTSSDWGMSWWVGLNRKKKWTILILVNISTVLLQKYLWLYIKRLIKKCWKLVLGQSTMYWNSTHAPSFATRPLIVFYYK